MLTLFLFKLQNFYNPKSLSVFLSVRHKKSLNTKCIRPGLIRPCRACLGPIFRFWRHIGSDTRFDSNLARLYNISLLTRMLTRLYITRMLTRLESNLVITQSCGISYHLYSCCSIILVVTVLSTFLWHYSWLIFLSLYHSCGYSLVNILVRYFTLDNLAIGQSCDKIYLL